MDRLGVITGLVREVDCFTVFPADRRPRVHCAGIGPARAARAARRLLDEGCGALLSFGIAGGLDPALVPGTAVVAEAVVAPDGRRFATEPAWHGALFAVLAGQTEASAAAIAGSDAVVATPGDKRRLFEATGAVAVDMESHAVAAVADEARVPFLVLRLVSDSAAGLIPPVAMKGVGLNGRERHLAVAAALLRRPGDLPALLRLRRDSARAFRSLRRVALLAGPGFGLGEPAG